MSDIDYVGMIVSSDEDAIQSGVKGMKWGVRKSYQEFGDKHQKGSPGALSTAAKTKYGERISVVKERPGALNLAVAKLTGRKPENSVAAMQILDSSGKKVGSFQIWKDPEYAKTIRGEWLEVNKSAQGRGYSKGALDALMTTARKTPGIDQVRLQVPSDAAPAKKIYGDLGFRKDKDLGDTPMFGNIEDWVADVKR